MPLKVLFPANAAWPWPSAMFQETGVLYGGPALYLCICICSHMPGYWCCGVWQSVPIEVFPPITGMRPGTRFLTPKMPLAMQT